jgi:hypothetical protein
MTPLSQEITQWLIAGGNGDRTALGCLNLEGSDET